MDAALVFSWDSVHPGRNALARQLARDTEAFWAEHADAGRTSRLVWFANADLSRQMNMVKGDSQTLLGISMSPEFQRISMRAGAILTDVKQSWYFTSESSEDLWATWWAIAEEIEGA